MARAATKSSPSPRSNPSPRAISPSSPLPTLKKSPPSTTPILNTVHDLVTSGENTATQLLADFPARAALRAERAENDAAYRHHKIEMDTFRKEMAEKRFNPAEKTFAFRQQQHQDRLTLKSPSTLNPQPSTPVQSNHLGPYASTEEELSERIRRQQGVPKEEWDRRLARNRELFHQKYNPDGTLKRPATPARSAPHLPQTLPEGHVPASLQSSLPEPTSAPSQPFQPQINNQQLTTHNEQTTH